MSDLKDRVALVIGGASGIGLASARALAGKGATVIISDLNGEAATRAAQGVKAAGGEAIAYEVDAASPPQLRSMFDLLGKTYGRLHVLFSNAGSRAPEGFNVTEEQIDAAVAINLKSHFFATNFAIPYMLPCAPHASIIYTSSAGALKFGGGSPLYNISKAGVLMLARAFARELGPARIRANAIAPGAIETAFPRWAGLDEENYREAIRRSGFNVPLGRIGQPEDVAGVVAFLASDESMYLTGLALPIDGGELA